MAGDWLVVILGGWIGADAGDRDIVMPSTASKRCAIIVKEEIVLQYFQYTIVVLLL